MTIRVSSQRITFQAMPNAAPATGAWLSIPEPMEAPKTIKSPRARDAGFGEVTLLVDERGLVGFETRAGAV